MPVRGGDGGGGKDSNLQFDRLMRPSSLPRLVPDMAEGVGFEPTRLLHRTCLANRLLTDSHTFLGPCFADGSYPPLARLPEGHGALVALLL